MRKGKLSFFSEKKLAIKKAKEILTREKNAQVRIGYRKNPYKRWIFPSYGPSHGILFVGDDNTDDITEKEGVTKKLELVFNEGINKNNCFSSVAKYIPFFTQKDKKYLIQSHATKEQAVQLTDRYSFVYVIQASRVKSLTSFPAAPHNTKNLQFSTGVPFVQEDNCQYFFITPSSLKPEDIIGAFAIGDLAHSLNINEETLIINPGYQGNREEIKAKLKINAIKELGDCPLIPVGLYYYPSENSSVKHCLVPNTPY